MEIKPLSELGELLEREKKTPPEDREEMKAACIADDVPRFKATFDRWLTYGFNIHELDKVVCEAVCRNNVEILSIITSHGFVEPYYGYAREAVEHRAKDVLSYFLSQGWNINHTAQKYPAILWFAVADEDMTVWLLDHGADPNQQTLIDDTPMSQAVRDASLSTIKILFERGADVHKGQLLHHAVYHKTDSVAILSLLLEKGAILDANMYDNHDVSWSLYYILGLGTALHHAATAGNLDAVKYLLDQGADPTIKDMRNRTPLGCVGPDHPEITAVLETAMKNHAA
ncbi:putative hspc200 [Aspergillus californicus]